MKSIQLIIVLLMASLVSTAQSKKYLESMEANITSLYEAESLEALDDVMNSFTRIGQAEKSQWEPFYYASLANVFKSFRIQDLQVQDAVLDQAHLALKSAAELSPDNAEVVALDGFINMMKIGVDPGTRGQSLSPKIMAAYGKALKLDPRNPRANLFMAQMLMGTAQFFGTGVEEPCKMIQNSIQFFDTYQPKSAIAPAWGRSMTLRYQDDCGGPERQPTEK